MNNETPFEKVVGPIRLPLEVNNEVDYHQLYFFEYKKERWGVALYGDVSQDTHIPLRIESACFFGHVFNSRQCDCGFQLDEAFRRIRQLGFGMVIYGIDQDARGLGIESHFRIYDLRQNQNLDTEEVFKNLHANLDNRSYTAVYEILNFLKIKKIKLFSNNPRRIKFLEENGFIVEREELEAALDRFNMATLMLEKEDLGYKWSFETHAHWLQPLQQQVENNLQNYAGRIVLNNEEVVAEWCGDRWDVANQLIPQVANKEFKDKSIILYLTDYPRVDEIKKYADLGITFIVMPIERMPESLLEEAAKYKIKLQDWARENKYATERPQWQLKKNDDVTHEYERNGEYFSVQVA